MKASPIRHTLLVLLATLVHGVTITAAFSQQTVVTDASVSARAAIEAYLEELPTGARQTVDGLMVAALRGDLEALGVSIEYNELPPDFGPDIAPRQDPVVIWRAQEPELGGLHVLAALQALLSHPPARIGTGRDARYVWPAFAEADLTRLSRIDAMTLIRLVGPAAAKRMIAEGQYSGWRLTITGDGVWHSFTPPLAKTDD